MSLQVALQTSAGDAPHSQEPDRIPANGASRAVGRNKQGHRQWQNAIAGALAGCATAAILHPLDIIRTRFQVNDGRDLAMPQYRNTGHAFFTIAKTEGFRGLYAGLSPAVLGSTMSWSLYFYFYSGAKERYKRWKGKELGASLHLAAASEAGALVSLLTNPIWLVKTRLQLQPPTTAGALPDGRLPYRNAVDAVRSIWRQEGIRGFYRGLGPSLLLVSHGAIQLTVYEELRKVAVRLRSPPPGGVVTGTQGEDPLSSTDYLVLGAASKLAAVLATYPYNVVRSRLQIRPDVGGQLKYASSWAAVSAILRHEGVKGFYKGIVPHVLRVAPSSSVTFFVYETTMKLLRQTPGGLP